MAWPGVAIVVPGSAFISYEDGRIGQSALAESSVKELVD
jgi:hypothetical protein